MEVLLPDGARGVYGGLGSGVEARIEVLDENFFKRCVLHGPIGFAEAYMAGEWTTPDLVKVIAWFILNSDEAEALQTRSRRGTGAFNLLNFANRLLHLRRPNSRRMSRENIREHYDLSNEFFQLWLDPTMTYSSAYFERADEPLEAAQIRKYDKLCRRLHIAPTDSVLEIGSGWGGFSMHAAKTYGCRVTTVTISQQQFDEASRRIQAAGLGEKIQILLCDYRDLRGQFDKIASIEMLEAVGDKYVDGYFEKIDQLLAPRGLAGLQAILCPDNQYPILRDGVDFIQKHIFPGSLLLSLNRVNDLLSRSGGFTLHHIDDLGHDYARTLRLWDENFRHRTEQILALGFDDRFMRKWSYYLAYCESAFAMRNISVVQTLHTRANNLSL